MISKSYLENGTTDIVYKNESTIGVVEMKYNNNSISDSTSSVILGSGNKLVLKIKINKLEKYNRINSIKLKIKPSISDESKDIVLTKVVSFDNDTGNKTKKFSKSESGIYEVELADFIVGQEANTFYFKISSEGAHSVAVNSNDSPYLNLNYFELAKSLISRETLNGSVGSTVSYGIDLRNGGYIVKKSLYHLEGCLMPINLNLVYSSYVGHKIAQEGLPLGWKFNYFQKLTFSNDNILYLDYEGIEHEFNVSNSSDKYYDISGSKLVITAQSNVVIKTLVPIFFTIDVK